MLMAPPQSAWARRWYAAAFTRASGGIGRRAGFRFLCPQGRGGSSPPSPTPFDLRFYVREVPHPVVAPADCNPIATLRTAGRCDTGRHEPASDDPPSAATTLGWLNIAGQ